MVSPKVRDLLSQPYAQMRCDQVVAEVYRRAGVELPPWAAPEKAEDYHAVLERVHEASTWARVHVDGLPQYLDLVLCKREKGKLGVAVMLSSQQAITSTPERGVHVVPFRALHRIVSVYRLQEVPT